MPLKRSNKASETKAEAQWRKYEASVAGHLAGIDGKTHWQVLLDEYAAGEDVVNGIVGEFVMTVAPWLRREGEEVSPTGPVKVRLLELLEAANVRQARMVEAVKAEIASGSPLEGVQDAQGDRGAENAPRGQEAPREAKIAESQDGSSSGPDPHPYWCTCDQCQVELPFGDDSGDKHA